MKRILSVFLVALLLCGMTLPAYAAAESAGTTIRLSESSGTVTVKDAAGKEASVKTDMRLYNGYTVETGLKSSAYLSLDGTKAVKLDSSTRVEVKKSGKQLEVALVTGNVFFSVEEPLATDESFNIRTSTMVTGIRGSFGWVNPREAGMIHGHAEVICTNPETGESRTTEIVSGEGVRYEAGGATGGTGEGAGNQELKDINFDKTVLTVSDVPAIAAEEIAADPQKQEQIQQDVPTLDAQEIVESADEKRAQEDAAEQTAEEAVKTEIVAQEQEIAALEAEEKAAGVTDEVKFEAPITETTEDSGDSGGGGGSSNVSGNPADSTALMSQLASRGSVTLNAGGWTISYTGVTVGAGQTLNITGGGTVSMPGLTIAAGGEVVVASGAKLAVSGTDVVQRGKITNSGTVENTAEMALLGEIENKNGGAYTNTGTLAIAPGARFTGGTVNNTGTIIIDRTATFTPSADVTGNGKVINNQ